jgi:hypothetical protein
MHHIDRMAAVLVATLLSCSVARAAEQGLPAAVTAELKIHTDMCREAQGKPDSKQAVQRLDLTGDGAEDYLLDVAGISCEGAWSIFGDREKAVSVFVGDGKGGAAQAFTDSVYGVTVERKGPSAMLWLTVAAAQCGRKPAKDFASESFCDRALVWKAASGRFEYAPVSTVRMIQ